VFVITLTTFAAITVAKENGTSKNSIIPNELTETSSNIQKNKSVVTEAQLYEELINQQKLMAEIQKDKVTDLYQFINFATAIIGILVAAIVAVFFEASRRLKKIFGNYQNKLESILNSKEFDLKLSQIERNIAAFNNYKVDSETQLKELKELLVEIKNNGGSEKNIGDVEEIISSESNIIKVEDISESKINFVSPIKRVTRDFRLLKLVKKLAKETCDLCEGTFKYLEIHRINPEEGEQMGNLSVLCPNCHRLVDREATDLAIQKIKKKAEERKNSNQ
jgi:predicted HNH restriction endonuclease